MNRGISIGLKNLIFFGGYDISISIFGEIDEWKNVQKNEIKNINSDKINKIILNFKKLVINIVCIPWNVLSRIISRNHNIIIKIELIKFKIINIEIDL